KSTPEQTKENLLKLQNFLASFKESDFETVKSLEIKIMAWIKANNYGVGDMLWPMRVALSGQQNSPSPFEIAWILGQKVTLERITNAIIKL
ncbi:MAG: glutamate--tRNA ligase, partial [Candidatus Parcubacteria bacterium]|nr:glutamate--tRNA ligase [Candidatus Parcubacteria bacterium]